MLMNQQKYLFFYLFSGLPLSIGCFIGLRMAQQKGMLVQISKHGKGTKQCNLRVSWTYSETIPTNYGAFFFQFCPVKNCYVTFEAKY